MSDLDLWQSLGVALAIGLLVGAERERSHPGQAAGIRTFALVAVIGAVAVQLPTVVAAVLCSGVAALVIAGYVVSPAAERGVTTETAVLATLGLGALTRSEPVAAVGLAVAVTVLLVSRENLHRFVRETVTDAERTDALVFFVAAFVVLPVLPAGRVGPYGAWVPQRIWLLVVLIIAIGWIGYTAVRLLGTRRGLVVGGLAGGFVSGTATTGVMAAHVRRGEAPMRSALAGAVMASVSTLVLLVALTALVDVDVSLRLLPAMATGAGVLGLEAWWLGRSRRPDEEDTTAAGRPFAIAPAVLLAVIISAVLPLSLWLQDRFGTAGALAASAAAALADVHGTSVAMATLVHGGDLTLAAGVTAISAGLVTNTVSKLVVATVAGGPRFAGYLLLCLLPAAVAVAVVLTLTSRLA